MTDFLTETFTAPDGTDLASHTSDSGSSWSVSCSGCMLIESDAITGPTFGNAWAYSAATPPSADYQVEGNIIVSATGGADHAELLGRAAGSFNTYYALDFDSGTPGINLTVCSGGGCGNIATSSWPGYGAGTFHGVLQMSGSTITAVVDGVTLMSVTDTTLSAAGVPGINMPTAFQGNVLIDNLTAGDISGGGGGGTVLTGVGSIPIANLGYVIYAITGSAGVQQQGAANPRNLYHVALFRQGTATEQFDPFPLVSDNGVFQVLSGVTTLWYAIQPGITVTITESSSP